MLLAAASFSRPAARAGIPSEENARLLAQVEPRFKAIYERDEFAINSLTATWLPDGLGYLKLETPAGASAAEVACYDSTSGQRMVVVPCEKLVVPGISQPLMLRWFQRSPSGNRFLLHGDITDGERKSGHWLYEPESGALRPVDDGPGLWFDANAFFSGWPAASGDAWRRLDRVRHCQRPDDSAKKYPVFVLVYGEPVGQTVLDGWRGENTLFHRAVADLGYIVVSMDNRGTPAPEGAAWRRSVFGSLGPLSTEDQAAGLQALGRLCPFVDLTRVGIWGWSGGGSCTLNAMFRKPDIYHVGIAVVPKPQPQYYIAWYQEIYMRTPKENPEGYHTSAPINYAEGLRGDLLIITGSGETNTHVEITEGLVDRLVALGNASTTSSIPIAITGSLRA